MAKLLLLEDDPEEVDLILTALDGGIDVEAVSRLNEGLVALLTRGPFDLIVSDLNMPPNDAVTVLDCLKEGGSIPIIVFSGEEPKEIAPPIITFIGKNEKDAYERLVAKVEKVLA